LHFISILISAKDYPLVNGPPYVFAAFILLNLNLPLLMIVPYLAIYEYLGSSKELVGKPIVASHVTVSNTPGVALVLRIVV